jgi:hypothetical protein
MQNTYGTVQADTDLGDMSGAGVRVVDSASRLARELPGMYVPLLSGHRLGDGLR